jgi:hypothetical protein
MAQCRAAEPKVRIHVGFERKVELFIGHVGERLFSGLVCCIRNQNVQPAEFRNRFFTIRSQDLALVMSPASIRHRRPSSCMARQVLEHLFFGG